MIGAAAAGDESAPRYFVVVVAPLLVEAVVELSAAVLLVLPVLLVLIDPLLVVLPVLSEPLLVMLPVALLDVEIMLLLALALVAGSVCIMIWTFAPVGGVAIAAAPPPLPLLIRMKAAISELPEDCWKAPVQRLPELALLPDEVVLLIVLAGELVLADELVLTLVLPLSSDELLDVDVLLMLAVPPFDDLKLPLQPASGSIVW